ncbi:hypothetical protein M9H77_02726 [Catharanthus roseus]|uniref:Uncharacterized protein n=1 Tax=Catharanthus roseus TaxID=4058 RepID=A0ACC0C9M7_CATRO|nr:hypothetical protein M9H77_02726 [Catharanthus roseus]
MSDQKKRRMILRKMRTNEMSEEKQENSKEELDVFEKNEEINFFANQTNSSLEIKLFSLVFIEHGDNISFLNSLGTYLERRYFIEFNSISCEIPRVDEYDSDIANCVSCVLRVDDRRSMEKELGPILEDLRH